MKVAILGVGAFGIALAKVFYANNVDVSMWTKFKEEADVVLLKRENKRVLPGVKIPKKIEIFTNLQKCIENANIIVIATPMSAVREVSKKLSNYLTKDQIICITSKGIEQKTNKFMSEVVFEETNSKNICMLSGPSFANDIASGLETGMIVASKSDKSNVAIKVCLENENILIDTTNDIRGVEICAAIKNVFAIFMGIMDGMKKSDSTKAAILTCIVNDMTKILSVLGGKSQTIFNYAGIGDLLLTCMSSKSRNYTLGKYIGCGNTLKEALDKMDTTTVEGLYTLNSIIDFLKKNNVCIKSIDMLYNIIYRNGISENILGNIK